MAEQFTMNVRLAICFSTSELQVKIHQHYFIRLNVNLNPGSILAQKRIFFL